MKTTNISPLTHHIQSLREFEKVSFGVWCVYRLLMQSTNLISAIEKGSERSGLFLDFKSLLENTWALCVQESFSLDQDRISSLKQSFSEILWDQSVEANIDDEHNFRLAGFLLDSSELLLEFLTVHDDNILGWCAESAYNFRDYEASFHLNSSTNPSRDERQIQFDFLTRVRLQGVKAIDLSD